MRTKKLSKLQLKKLQADDLLRVVDNELVKFGPRRAMQRLKAIRLHMPYGTARQSQQYIKFLDGMIARHEKALEYGDSDECGRRVRADLRGLRSGHAEKAKTKL